MKRFLRSIAVGIAISATGFAASAATLLDFSPETTGISSFFLAGNNDGGNGQNWGTLLTLSGGTSLTAIDRYAPSNFGFVGQGVVVKIWTGDGATLLHDIATTITQQDADGAGTTGALRSRAEFDVDLSAGSYLIGVAGNGNELAQNLLNGTSGSTFRFSFDTLVVPERTASIRVFGDSMAAVPLPAGLPLLLGALGAFAICARRRAN